MVAETAISAQSIPAVKEVISKPYDNEFVDWCPKSALNNVK